MLSRFLLEAWTSNPALVERGVCNLIACMVRWSQHNQSSLIISLLYPHVALLGENQANSQGVMLCQLTGTTHVQNSWSPQVSANCTHPAVSPTELHFRASEGCTCLLCSWLEVEEQGLTCNDFIRAAVAAIDTDTGSDPRGNPGGCPGARREEYR